LQDATLRLADVGFDRKARRLALLINRYRREADAPSRIRSALRVETVEAVQRAGWPNDPEAVTVILSLAQDGDWLIITCAAGIAIRARIEVIDLVLEDMGDAWGTMRVPQHD
jgi:cobalamin biosynthesis protein CbiG